MNQLLKSIFLLQVFITQCWSSASAFLFELCSQWHRQDTCRVRRALFNELLGQGSFSKTCRNYLVGGRWGEKGTGESCGIAKITEQPRGCDSQVTLKCLVLLCVAQQSLIDLTVVNAIGKG